MQTFFDARKMAKMAQEKQLERLAEPPFDKNVA